MCALVRWFLKIDSLGCVDFTSKNERAAFPNASETQKKKSKREVHIDRYSSEKREREREREEQRRHSFSFARRVAILGGRET